MPPRIGISMFFNNVKVYMWSRRQGSCSLFTLPKKTSIKTSSFVWSSKGFCWYFFWKLYWEWRICSWISARLPMGNIIYFDNPHLYWVCVFDEVYLTQWGTWKKWCTIHGYFRYCTYLLRFQNCVASHWYRGVFLFHQN
jgi:hypothetical protein